LRAVVWWQHPGPSEVMDTPIGWSIKIGHDKYRVIFAKLYKSTEKDAKMREEAFLTYKRDLLGHHEGEEKHVFPAMIKIPDLKDMALDLEMEHSAMKSIVKELTVMGYDHAMWRYHLAPLYAILLHHWHVEEEQLIPFLGEYFTQAQLDEIGNRFDETVASYNKRPLSDFEK
jgi:hemerythrin superfamily protein